MQCCIINLFDIVWQITMSFEKNIKPNTYCSWDVKVTFSLFVYLAMQDLSWLPLFQTYVLIYYVWERAHVPKCTCRSLKTTCACCFSPSQCGSWGLQPAFQALQHVPSSWVIYLALAYPVFLALVWSPPFSLPLP